MRPDSEAGGFRKPTHSPGAGQRPQRWPARGRSRDPGQNFHDTQSYIPASPGAGPNYPSPGSSSFQAGPASQSLVAPSSSSVRYYGVPQMAPQSLLDDQWEDFEEPNMGPQNSSNIEREYGDYPRMSPQSFLDSDWQDYGDPQMSPQYILDLDWQGDDNLRMEPQPPLGSKSGGREQTGSHLRVPGQDGGGGGGGPLLRGARRYKNPILSHREVKDIRVKWAAGWTLNMIHEDFYPGSSVNSIKVYLRNDGWKAWTTEEDTKLRGMESQAGAKWPQIRAQFNNRRQGVWRDEEEIQARLEHLKHPQNAPKRQKHSIFIFSPDDDRYITSSVAQGKMWEEQRKERFPQMGTYSIRKHAIKIGAFWDSEDDQKLQGNIPRQGMKLDWNFIARKYNPPRDVEIIKMRWEYLQKQKEKNAGIHRTMQS